MIRLAVLSDPHLHDPAFGRGPGAEPLLRSLAETAESTRVFNESGPALRQALREIAAERPPICLIAGDLTDDGQPANWRAVARLLADHSARHGTRFFACPGNHDQWAISGKPLVKGFVDAAGRVRGLSATGEPGTDPCPGMRLAGYDEAWSHAAALGHRRDPRDLLWETPFGPSDAPADRIGGGVPDASYLVEPVAGLWILSLDANVYLPDGQGGFTDCSTLGWSAALGHKSWLLPWIGDVVRRAESLGKRLVAFSHYPVCDIFSGSIPELDRLGGRKAGRRRMPSAAESRAIAATGLKVHFSGHWHVDAVAEVGGLVNVSIPSPVGFPAGWKLAELAGDGIRLSDRPLRDVPGFDLAAPRYRREAARTGRDGGLGTAPDYADFLDRHFRDLVLNRRLAEDWPEAMRPLMAWRLGELPGAQAVAAQVAEAADLPFAEVFLDWYRLREAGGGPAAAVPAARRQIYAILARRMGEEAADPQALLPTFFRTLGRHLEAGQVRQRAFGRDRAAAEC